MHIDQATQEQLQNWEQEFSEQYAAIKNRQLNLDLTRGKPSSEQLTLSNSLDGILNGNYTDASGVDVRNYGGLEGIQEAKALFSQIIEVDTDEILVGGNSSLALMYQNVALLLNGDPENSGWKDNIDSSETVKFICPVPGYDRHFSVCEHLGIEMVNVPMLDSGPDMDQIEALVTADPSIKGMWCVPRFSNPTGAIYDTATVSRIAKLAKINPDFCIFWDNAYALHALTDDANSLSSIMHTCKQQGTENNIFIFGSTSKITFAGAGIAFLGTSKDNIAKFAKNSSFSSIGPDKVNQLRHVKFLKDINNIKQHMRNHAELIKPKFDCVQKHLNELKDMGEWSVPKGGYFISFNAQPGVASTSIKLAAGLGVKLTPAGATFPYGKDPEDRNIRIAPTFPSLKDVDQAMQAFVICVKLASCRELLTAKRQNVSPIA